MRYVFGGYRSKCLGDLHVLDLGIFFSFSTSYTLSPLFLLFSFFLACLFHSLRFITNSCVETLTWSQPVVTGIFPTPRSSHSAVAWESKLVIFGGSGHKYSSEVFTFDTSTNIWQKEETYSDTIVPSDRWCHTAVRFGKSIHISVNYKYVRCFDFAKKCLSSEAPTIVVVMRKYMCWIWRR